MRKRKLCMCMSVVSALVLLSAGCSGSLGRTNSITIGVRDDITNFGYLNTNTNKYSGIEIDLATELADRLGYDDVDFVTVTPETRKEKLLDGEVDCIVALYSIADTREENFDFSVPYYTDQTSIMVEDSSLILDLNGLQDKRIGVVSGTNAGPLLATTLRDTGLMSEEVISNTDTETIYDHVTIVKAESYEALSNLLEVGTVDAICMDKCITHTYMDNQRSLLDVVIAEQQYGVATQKGSDLSTPVNDAVQEMLDDGTMETIIDKWD